MSVLKLQVMLHLLAFHPEVLTTSTMERRDPEDVAAELSAWADAILEQADQVTPGILVAVICDDPEEGAPPAPVVPSPRPVAHQATERTPGHRGLCELYDTHCWPICDRPGGCPQ